MRPWPASLWLRRRAGHEPARTRRMRATVRAIRDAWQRGDAVELARSLTRDVVLLVDAGGDVPVADRKAVGADAAAAALLAMGTTLSMTAIAETEVNGGPGLALLADRRVVGVIGVDRRGRVVSHVFAVVNPAKLAHWNR